MQRRAHEPVDGTCPLHKTEAPFISCTISPLSEVRTAFIHSRQQSLPGRIYQRKTAVASAHARRRASARGRILGEYHTLFANETYNNKKHAMGRHFPGTRQTLKRTHKWAGTYHESRTVQPIQSRNEQTHGQAHPHESRTIDSAKARGTHKQIRGAGATPVSHNRRSPATKHTHVYVYWAGSHTGLAQSS